MVDGKRPLSIRGLPLSEADRKADSRQTFLAGAAGGVAATLVVLVMLWVAWRPAPAPEPPTPLPGLPAREVSGPSPEAPGSSTPVPTPSPSPEAPAASPSEVAATLPTRSPSPAASPASPAASPASPARVPAASPSPRRLGLPNSYPHATATPHASAPAPQASPKPEPRAGAPRPAERQGRSDLVDVAVSRGRASNPAGPTGAVESNFSYRLSRVVNRSDETLHLSSRNLFLEDAAGRSYPVSRYYSLDLLRGQGLTEGEDPVVDEQKLTIHFDYLPKDFVPDRLVLDLDSGRVQVRVAGMMLERQSVPSIPTW